MTDSTMVEKVARAIRIARTGPEVPGWSWADVEENKRAEYRGYARAAIEAIEPLVERAFKDGVAIGFLYDVPDPAAMWLTSKVRSSLKGEGE